MKSKKEKQRKRGVKKSQRDRMKTYLFAVAEIANATEQCFFSSNFFKFEKIEDFKNRIFQPLFFVLKEAFGFILTKKITEEVI